MSDSTAPTWAPPGLPPATARGARDHRSAVTGGLVFLGVSLAFAVLRGVRPGDFGLVLFVLAFVGAVTAFLTLKLLRAEVLAGPGWLSGRELVRRRWVRSDQLASVEVTRSGIERVLTFRDVHGRKVGLVMADLALDPAVRRQLARDVRASLESGAEVGTEGRRLLLDDVPR